jgi:hypothetical protein
MVFLPRSKHPSSKQIAYRDTFLKTETDDYPIRPFPKEKQDGY